MHRLKNTLQLYHVPAVPLMPVLWGVNIHLRDNQESNVVLGGLLTVSGETDLRNGDSHCMRVPALSEVEYGSMLLPVQLLKQLSKVS